MVGKAEGSLPLVLISLQSQASILRLLALLMALIYLIKSVLNLRLLWLIELVVETLLILLNAGLLCFKAMINVLL